jgi:hypothetical protein
LHPALRLARVRGDLALFSFGKIKLDSTGGTMRVTSLLLLPLTTLVAGCVSATAITQVPSCAPSQQAFADMLKARQIAPQQPVTSFDQTNLGKTSDLQVGAALIAASSKTRSAEAAFGIEAQSPTERYARSLSFRLGMNLSQFSDQALELNDRGAADADAAMASPAVSKLAAQTEALASVNAGSSSEFQLSRRQWQSSASAVYRATAEKGWTSAFARDLGALTKSGAVERLSLGTSTDTDVAAYGDLTKKYLLAAYMVAYFRNGQIFDLTFNQAALEQKLIARLKTVTNDQAILAAAQSEIDNLTTTYTNDLCQKGTTGNCVLLGVIGQQTFVTRAGKSYGFPGITATIDFTSASKISTNKLDPNAVVSDLVRVLIEAAGDSKFKVPGVKTSTLCLTLTTLCATDAQAGVVQSVDTIGDEVEGAATSMVGTAIRGGSIASLNNEALANVLTTASAVSARKLAEASAWSIEQKACTTVPGATKYSEMKFKVTP